MQIKVTNRKQKYQNILFPYDYNISICYVLKYFISFLDEPNRPFKEEGDRIFFSYDDKISMSIEYYDSEASNAKPTLPGIQKSLTNGGINGSGNVDGNGIDSSGECEDKETSTNNNNNPNKRYLECPGSVKVQHLKKFIIMKYGLNEDFLVSTCGKTNTLLFIKTYIILVTSIQN